MTRKKNAIFALFAIALFGATMVPVESARAETVAGIEVRGGVGSEADFHADLEARLQAKAEDSIGEAAAAVARLEIQANAAVNGTAPSVGVLLAEARDHLDRARDAYAAGRYGEALGLSMSAKVLAENGLKLAEKGPEARRDFEERYDDTRANVTSIGDEVREHRKSFEEFRDGFREAEKHGDEQAVVQRCDGAVKEARKILRLDLRLLSASLDQVADFGDSVISANVTATNLSAELRTEISTDESAIEANVTIHIEAIPGNVTSKAQCDEAREKLRTAVEEFRDEFRGIHARYSHYACMGLATRSYHLIANVERFVDRLADQGVDVKDLRTRLADAKAKAQDLVAECRSGPKAGASEMFQASNAIVKDLRALLQEVVRSARAESENPPTPTPTPTPTATPTPTPTPPHITGYSNNLTLDATTNLTVNVSQAIRFSATADQSVTLWSWSVNGTAVSNNYDNLTVSWPVNTTLGSYNTVAVNATNGNGTSQTVEWNVAVSALANESA